MTNHDGVEKATPFACQMEAIEADQRAEHVATAKELFSIVSEIKELSHGYAFRLPNESEVLLKVAKFISLERLCCPFFGFTLDVEREGGDVWLQLTGREGVKPFIRAEIGEFVSETSASWDEVSLINIQARS
jgi:hypothetical protein